MSGFTGQEPLGTGDSRFCEEATVGSIAPRKGITMDFEIRVDGQVAVKMEINTSIFSNLLQTTALGSMTADSKPASAPMIAKSAPMTRQQAQELLSRIDGKSAHFLKQLAANNGTIKWADARAIFGIQNQDNWSEFSAGYGKGITRAVRHILGDKSARLVWWIDEEWEDMDEGLIYVDGPALDALREASGVSAAS